MKRQGSELKQRKLINLHPKQPDKEQYRDLVKQNEWLRNTVFDSLGKDKISGVIVDDNSILSWSDKVSQKYSKLPGIRDLHDFLIVQNPTTSNAMMLVCEFCHGGAAKATTLSLNAAEFNCCPGPSDMYHQLRKTRVLQSTKLAHLQQMYSSYTAPEQWFEFLK